MMSKVIGLNIGNEIEWHAVNGVAGADYTTLCGIDADDPGIGHYGTVDPPPGQKIECRTCYNIWKGVVEMRFRESHFDVQK